MMATAAEPEPLEVSELECPVCHEYFTEPRILPCGHLLCCQCLLSWLQSHPDAQCPLCRCAIVDPGKAKSKETWQELANSLHTDATMVALVKAARTLSEKHACVVCEDVAAEYVCLDCKDMLCAACNKAHKKLSMLKHHTTEALASMTPERLATSGHVTCSAHAQGPATLYCASHDAAICSVCAMTRHRACGELKELGERVEETRRAVGKLLETLGDKKRMLEAAIKELDKHLSDLDTQTEAALARLDATWQDIQRAGEEHVVLLKQKLVSAKDQAKQRADLVKTAFLQRKAKLTSHELLVTRAHRVAPPLSAGDVTVPLKTLVESLDLSTTLPTGVKAITMPELETDRQAIERVQRELEGVYKLADKVATLSFQPAPPEAPREAFRFHTNHGKNVVLSDGQRTAERTQGYDNGIVLSSQPMQVGFLYEVLIEQNDPNSGYTMFAGVTTADPVKLTLPRDASRLPKQSSVILFSGYHNSFGTQLNTDYGQKLVNLPVGSRVGFYLDTDSRLHFVLDGKDKGVVCDHVPAPCYAFFDLLLSYKKFKALPLTPMP